MSENESLRRPILFKGEVYSSRVKKKAGGPTKELPYTYERSCERLSSDVSDIRSYFSETPEQRRLPNEFVVCVRMHPDFSAKSYYPGSIFSADDGKFEEVGSRLWRPGESDDEKIDTAKLIFVRTTDEGLSYFQNRLINNRVNTNKNFKEDVRKITSIDLLKPEEQVLGFAEDWEDGLLEAVLHPFHLDQNIALNHFFDLLAKAGVNKEDVQYKQYEDGISFVSFKGNRRVLDAVSSYNPLRTIHPLGVRNVPDLRNCPIVAAPSPPSDSDASNIIVGMFDGGIQENNPYLKNYCENIEAASALSDDGFVEHGTAVAGAILYGPLNQYGPSDQLPAPNVSVRSFRVLPNININLYGVIDAIESIVPLQDDIKVYNLSIGPRGPILDDQITRFTYACELLAHKYDVLFCIAVGNDGEYEWPENRIQAPSDMVNGLAVGAFTKIDGVPERAPYSCVGPGREGNKLKPDLSAFGGCSQTPTHLVSTGSNEKKLSGGTSYASPLVSSMAAQLIGRSNNSIDPLVARALLIHKARQSSDGFSEDVGHGIIQSHDVELITTCMDNSYTLIYRGEVDPGKYVKLDIPWPNDQIEKVKGSVQFHWTVAVLSEADVLSPDDYTASAVQVTFYPNVHRFRFEKMDGKKKISKIVDVKLDKNLAEDLKGDGWSQSNFPVADYGPTPFATEGRLKSEMKWDTIDHRTKGKQSGTLVEEPMFHLHALSRGSRRSNTKVQYALVLTIEAPKSEIDIYSEIIKVYSALSPLNLVNVNKVRAIINS